ncbi:MAG: GlsB/YeaQ/YmgE family stress response membrane protein [Anaerolineae bacterium]|nr:GlsB/YeaQ/YmgE family stress response membrane protein [Anaerolineae bacterium]
MRFLVWIISGIVAGWLTGLVMKGRGYGLIGDLVIGLLGGVIGGWLFSLFGVATHSWLGEILVAVIGGVVLVAIVRVLRRA